MIIGHEKIVDKLNEIIQNNNLMHSYIFSGKNAIGKKLVAYNFAKTIMCKDDINKVMFENENHPDFKVIVPDEKNSIKIDVIRQIIKDASIKPVQSEYKIYIIDDSDTMTIQAQNALLKTLEEPPHNVVFILITSKYFLLLDTIRSRSQKVSFDKLSDKDIIKYLNENRFVINIDNNIMLRLIDGSIGNVKKVYEDAEIINKTISYISKIENTNIIEVNEFSKNLIENKKNIFNLLDYITNIFYYKLVSENNDKERCIKCIGYVEQAKKNIESNINFDISIDKLLIDMWEEYNV